MKSDGMDSSSCRLITTCFVLHFAAVLLPTARTNAAKSYSAYRTKNSSAPFKKLSLTDFKRNDKIANSR